MSAMTPSKRLYRVIMKSPFEEPNGPPLDKRIECGGGVKARVDQATWWEPVHPAKTTRPIRMAASIMQARR